MCRSALSPGPGIRAAVSGETFLHLVKKPITTILSFGLLGLSQSPGLAALGITVTLGVTFSLVFCFVMASLSGPNLVTRDLTP